MYYVFGGGWFDFCVSKYFGEDDQLLEIAIKKSPEVKQFKHYAPFRMAVSTRNGIV